MIYVESPMPKEMVEFLNLERLPGRISLQQASWLTGISEHGLHDVVAAGLLKRLGGASADGNTTWWFSSAALLRFIQDPDVMSKATSIVIEAGRKRNGTSRKTRRRKGADGDPSLN